MMSERVFLFLFLYFYLVQLLLKAIKIGELQMFLDNGHDLAKMFDVLLKSVDLAFADVVVDYMLGFG